MNLNIFNTASRKQVSDAFYHDETRTAMVASIADLKTERADKIKPLTSDLQRATTAVEKAQQTLLLAQSRQHTAEQLVNQTKAGFKHRISRTEAKLLASAPDSINETIELLKHDLRVLCGQLPPAPVTGFTAKARRQAVARNELIKVMDDRRESLRNAITQAEGLRLSTAEDISAGLAKIRETLDLPPIASMQ